MRRPLSHRHALVLVLAFAVACSDSTASSPDRAEGIYTLVVTDRGPASGSFILSADGRAARRVHYASIPDDIVYVGGFVIDADRIAFSLGPGGRFGDFPWGVSGQWLGSEFTIVYPDPVDGPDIVERYRRR